MIRVNLLTGDPYKKRSRARVPVPNEVSVGAGLLILATAVTIGCWFWSLRETSRALDRDLASAEAENHQLQAAVANMERLETRRVEMQQRVSILEQLLNRRTSPARMLEMIGGAVPVDLWLVEVAHKDPDLTLKGLATTLAGVSDLVANLEASGVFRAPVEIIETEAIADPGAGRVVRFSMKARVH